MHKDGGRGRRGPLLVETDVTDAEARAFALPTGTVTFLLTDVEGSSRMWEQAPEAMAEAVPRHYAILDELIAGHGGVRPVEQGEGDSVVGAFSRASDAVAAALAAQEAFTAEPWPEPARLRVRIAVHTGEALIRDAGNYFGQAVIRCARIRAIGHGGQVLVSDATAALVADRLGESAGLTDLGTHRLKDLGRPERVWQLVHPGLPEGFPPLRSLDAFRHNLPVQLTPLIGRTGAMGSVVDLLVADRLVTLTGAGGIGKSRLALAVAAETVESHAGGVWWVELAPIAAPGGVARAVLAALGAAEVAGAPGGRQLAVELGDGPCLVVLDNCEHLLDECAALVDSLLADNPAVSVLATSREPLGVPGEVIWRVPSLPVPPPETLVSVETLSQYEAVRLFVDRARRSRPSFVVDEANAPAIAQICQRLDGIPLAIELAAARCRQMTADQIAGELDNRFRLLTGGARTVMARQQTLAASLDWSHDRLDEPEQLAFRRLGVFAGPFPLEAAEAVVSSAGGVEPTDVFDLLSRLADKSLIAAVESPRGELRYRLLETLRAYALDRARVAGELPSLRTAHAMWWTEWMELRGELPSDAVVDLVDEYHDNFTAALAWAIDDLAIDLGLRLLGALGRSWQTLGRAGPALDAADRLLNQDGADEHAVAWLKAAGTMAILYVQSGRFDGYFTLLNRIEHIADEAGQPFYAALARWFLTMGEVECQTLRELARGEGIVWIEALASIVLAIRLAEDPAAAADVLADIAELVDAADNEYLRFSAMSPEILVVAADGDMTRALMLGRQQVEARSAAQAASGMIALGLVGLLTRDGDAVRLAQTVGDRARRTAPDMDAAGDLPEHVLSLLAGARGRVDPQLREPPPFNTASPAQQASILWVMCREAIDAGEPAYAAERAETFSRPTPFCRAVTAAVVAAATQDEVQWHAALDVAVEYGFRPIAVDAFEGLAVEAAAASQWADTLRLVGAAERLREETGYQFRFGCEQRTLDRALDDARAAVGDDAGALIEEGRGLDCLAAAEYARRARGRRQRPRHGWAGLTPTEDRVVALIAEGLTNPQIAERLLMGRATVKTHLEHIFTKLGIHTRTELAAEAARREAPTASDG